MDAETPAGRLVTALRERGIKSEASDDTDGVIVNGLFVDAVDCGWGISGNGDDLDGNIEAAANAIAAIVQAPGLRLNIPREEYAHDVIQAFTDGEEFGGKNVNRWFGHHYDIGDGEGPQFDARKAWQEHVTDRVGQVGPPEVAELRRERDTLATEVKRLREELEKPIAEPWEHGRCVRWCGHAEVADVDINGFVGWTVYRDRVAIAHGPESGAAGKHAADLALIAAGYRLVGGVHPLPDEVPNV